MACPPRDELVRFAVGDLDGAALARVAEHVEHCPSCNALLQTIDADADALVTSLRLPPVGESAAVPEAVLTAARSALDTRPVPTERPRQLGKF